MTGRATSYEEFVERMALMTTDRGEEHWRAFRPRATDLIISPYAKCGTTWLQQIVHGLRSGGDMDFDDISRVVPWIETAYDLGIDLESDQRAEPRAFKSHLSWHDVPKGGRYIVSVRDPKDAAVSMYRFMEGWFIEPGSVSIDEFVSRRSLDRGSGSDYWRHLASWLEQRHNPDVLLLAFEDMKDDLAGVVARITRFIGLDANETLMALVTHQASFEFMSRNKGPFADHLMRVRSEQVAGIPALGDASKVRSGEVGTHRRELRPEIGAVFDQIWAETIENDFGYTSYGDLIEGLRQQRLERLG